MVRDERDKALASAYAPAVVGSHLDEAGFERLLDGKADEGERTAASEHLLTCRECALVYAGLLDFDEGAAQFDPARRGAGGAAVTTLAPIRKKALLTGLALAASVVVGVGLLVERPRTSDVRSLDVTHEIALLPPGGARDASGRIAWRTVAKAPSYLVTVYSEDGRIVSRVKSQGPPVDWPVEARGAGVYFWRVAVVGRDDPNDDVSTVMSGLGRVEIAK